MKRGGRGETKTNKKNTKDAIGAEGGTEEEQQGFYSKRKTRITPTFSMPDAEQPKM